MVHHFVIPYFLAVVRVKLLVVHTIYQEMPVVVKEEVYHSKKLDLLHL
jgi:hypothetical protein